MTYAYKITTNEKSVEIKSTDFSQGAGNFSLKDSRGMKYDFDQREIRKFERIKTNER